LDDVDQKELNDQALIKQLHRVGGIDKLIKSAAAYQTMRNDLARESVETNKKQANGEEESKDTSTIIFDSNKMRTQMMNEEDSKMT